MGNAAMELIIEETDVRSIIVLSTWSILCIFLVLEILQGFIVLHSEFEELLDELLDELLEEEDEDEEEDEEDVSLS